MLEKKQNLLGLGISIAFGLIISSGIVSYTLNRVATNKQSVVVKGLAEKQVSADQARWSVVVSGEAKALSEAFAIMRTNRPKVLNFFHEQGFSDEQIETGREVFDIEYRLDKQGRMTNEIDRYVAKQVLAVSSSDVKRVDRALGKIVSLQEKGLPLSVSNPEYLVSSLEKIKMSLIADATRNAHDRANEFARTGDVKVGAMKSANQGAFYILPATGNSNDAEYGGVYDKTTIDKLARVVVTIEYGLTQ